MGKRNLWIIGGTILIVAFIISLAIIYYVNQPIVETPPTPCVSARTEYHPSENSFMISVLATAPSVSLSGVEVHLLGQESQRTLGSVYDGWYWETSRFNVTFTDANDNGILDASDYFWVKFTEADDNAVFDIWYKFSDAPMGSFLLKN